MTNTSSMALLVSLTLGCHAANPPRATEHYADGSSPECITLRVLPDGSIRAEDRVVYSPALDNAAEFKAFLAAERARNPDVTIRLSAEPDARSATIDRAAALTRDNALSLGGISVKIEGSVQTTFRSK